MPDTGTLAANPPNFNRILLPSVPVFRKRNKGFYADASILQFITEECISRGAVDIVVDGGRYSSAIERLPLPLKQRIVAFNDRDKTAQKLLGILDPILEEFGIVVEGQLGVFRFGRDIDHKFYGSFTQNDAMDCVVWLTGLDDFLISLEMQLQFHGDVLSMNGAAHRLFRVSRSPRARAHLATIVGVLSTYQPTALDALEVRSTASDRLTEMFQIFVEDETYRYMSEHAHSFGFPDRLERAITLYKRSVRKILSRPYLRSTVDLGSRYIATATTIPTPDTEMVEKLLGSRYLPPAIDMSDAIQQAKLTWNRLKPDFVQAWGKKNWESTEDK